MKLHPINRDEHGLAETPFCRETPDGGLKITFQANIMPYELDQEDLSDQGSFAATWQHLQEKSWLTPEIATDLVNVVTARWLAKDRGWI